jgi:hypothetical protein
MTLDTDPSHIPMGEKEPVRRPVRDMTDGASLHFDGGMLKNPGSPFLRMAFKAGIDIKIKSASCS